MKGSDPKRLAQARFEIDLLKRSDHSVANPVVGVGKLRLYRLDTRKWADVPEPAKLEMLKDMVNWEGITNRDQAHLLLGELNVGKLTRSQRDGLIQQAEPEPGAEKQPEPEPQRAARARDIDMER